MFSKLGADFPTEVGALGVCNSVLTSIGILMDLWSPLVHSLLHFGNKTSFNILDSGMLHHLGTFLLFLIQLFVRSVIVCVC